MTDFIEPSNTDLGDAPDSVRDYIEQLQDKLAELEQERDALAAHVETIKNNVATLDRVTRLTYLSGAEVITHLYQVINESPQTSLAERDARVIEDCLKVVGKMENHDKSILTYHNQISEHANKLRGDTDD